MLTIKEEERQEYLMYQSSVDVYKNLIQGLVNLDTDYLDKYKGNVLVCGGMLGFNQGISVFLNQWSNKAPLFLLSEVTAENRRFTDELIIFPHLSTPHLLAQNIYIKNMYMEEGLRYQSLCESDTLLLDTVQRLEKKYELGEGYAYYWTYCAKIYIEEVLRHLCPSEVYLWNQYTPFHILFGGLCKRRKINVLFLEYGCIPGTYSIDSLGQQGMSSISRRWFRHNLLHIRKNEKEHTKKIIDFINDSEINRYLQPQKANIGLYKEFHKSVNSVVLFIEQYDIESGIEPNDYINKKYNSPFFSSSLEAFLFVQEICKKNKWKLLYRQHPLMRAFSKAVPPIDYNTTIIVSEYNLNELINSSDVMVTISSQASYVSLFQKKPVVLLGRNELWRKGCVYQPCSRKKIEPMIKKACYKGLTKLQNENFISHLTRLRKYNLYDDMIERNMRYGIKI